ncbi:TRAP transporter fused permease subunit [Chelativorans sp. ZYF759]|uniref:TRAP transporter fused permease subunit n=1 Tax=Chelativorans sp. ZYF759 TaxID=2692213 RepID=UPI00145F2A40|nr:TRAP transporter fused permease subunit [Chelativorans sp. ZYF759]NMG40434.1 TRAP transporter fused permease subunit [Chelativorans sp. ZYF759]
MNDTTVKYQSDESALQRDVRGWVGWGIAGIAIVFSLFQLYQMGFGLMPAQNLRAVHLAFVLALIFLLYPTFKRWDMSRMSVLDALLAAASISGPLYFYFNFNAMVMRAGIETATDLFMGAVTIVALLEATRRAIGPVLPAIAIVFMGYAYLGPYMPELIAHRGYTPERIIRHLYPTTEGVFGIPLAVASTFVFLFVLFGAVMQRTGISDYLTRVAMSGLGHYRGGPAKSAVLASALMGSFSGSSTANVATTGTLTIPLMKRVGFRPESAGGIETAASTTGQFVPPVMGAAAFVMVEITGIPYVQIIQAALLPALLDLAGIIFCVHMHALKHKIHGLPRNELPPFFPALFSQIYLLIPIVGLILMLTVLRYTPTMSAFWAIPMALLISLVARNTIIVWRAVRVQMRGGDPFEGIEEALDRQRSEIAVKKENTQKATSVGGLFGKAWADWFKDMVKALEEGARQAIPISAACATAGIIIGIITLTGLGLRMQSILLTLSGGELWAALVFTALGSIILGLGVPTTANYIIMATLMAPALVQLEVPLLAAHLFVFYFGILADTTPPVGLGAYVAAGIARAGPIRTSVEGFKFSITAFIIPFMFVYNPQLILLGDWEWLELLWLVASGMVGVYALAVMKEGWWLTRANVIERIVITFAAILLIQPSVWVDIAGFAVMGGVYAFQMWKVRREAAHGVKEATTTSKVAMGAGVLALPVAVGWLFLPVVQVSDNGSSWSRTAFPGQQVTLAHMHSVERSLVEETFQLGWRGDLIHRRTVTRSMGAGLPDGGAARGGVMTTRGTGERHREIALRYGPENEPAIIVGETRRELSDLADGRAVELRVRHVWETLIGR